MYVSLTSFYGDFAVRYVENKKQQALNVERPALIAKFETSLFEKYGYYLTLKQLAELLNRSPEGLRVTMFHQTPTAEKLRAARLRFGRSLYFNINKVAELFV